jgi:hypothetical protein
MVAFRSREMQDCWGSLLRGIAYYLQNVLIDMQEASFRILVCLAMYVLHHLIGGV